MAKLQFRTISNRMVAALKVGKDTVFWDRELTGFGVRVLPSATKSFILNYRPGPGGRKAPNRRIVLGRCGIITPDQARRMAHEMLGRVAAGQDPAAERARARAGPTLREAFEEYLGAGPERKASTIASYRSTVYKDLASWLARPLDTISRKDVEQCFNRLSAEAGWVQANNALKMLRSLYLHHVLDEWFEEVAKPRLHGRCQLVRFADDFVIAFEDRHSGKRTLDVLGKRLGRYGLTLHETKTRYVDFRRRRPYGRHWMASATTFDFLGFTHVWGRSMQGKDVVRQITAKGRFARALKSVHDWCKRHRHLPIEAQRDHLAKVIRGHCAYYGLTGKAMSLSLLKFVGQASLVDEAMLPS